MINNSEYNGWKSVNKQEYLLRPLILAPRHSTIYHLETKYAHHTTIPSPPIQNTL